MATLVVNSVWHGVMMKPVDLSKLQRLCSALEPVRSTTLQTTQPVQLVIRFVNGGTMLVFTSGKFRVMGRIDDLDAHFNAYCITLLYDDIPDIKLQTMTACFTYPHRINLPLLADNIESQYSAERFPAVHVRKYKPINVNVFASGKVGIMGLRDDTSAINIEHELTSLLNSLLPLYVDKLL